MDHYKQCPPTLVVEGFSSGRGFETREELNFVFVRASYRNEGFGTISEHHVFCVRPKFEANF